MKNKLIKYLAIILIMNMLFMQFNLIFSGISLGFGESMKNEVGPMPSETHDDDDVDEVPEPDEDIEVKIEKNYIYYTGISGNAYEQISEDTGKVVNKETLPISNIIVEAKNERTGNIYKTYTDSDGNYSFTNLIGGDYTLTFRFGYYDESKSSDIDYMKTNLKYNGLDYTAKVAGKAKDKYTTMQKTIIRSGTGATEIMLAIDCSVSAWNTKLDNGKSRLDVQKEAAKELIESLINEKNVYIGIVCFAGGTNSAYLALHTTNNLDLLTETLDEIKPGGKCDYEKLPGGTNIVSALSKSDSSFASTKSNKWIILLSDGAPTTDGKEQIYNDDTDEDLKSKANEIAVNTKKKIKKITEKGIKMCSFIVDSDDWFEQDIVNYIFKGIESNKYLHSSDEKATKTIKEDILKHIKDETKVEEDMTEKIDLKSFDGVDDKERREAVNKAYEKYNYKNTTEIENLTNNYDATLKGNAEIFLNKTNMYVKVKYDKIDRLIGSDDDYWYFEAAGAVSKDRYPIIEDKIYTNQNLGLSRRIPLEMDIEIEVTGYRLTLSNGQIYNQVNTEKFVDRDLADGQIIKNIKEIGDSMYLQSIEEKVMYGSRVDIEYTIILKNTSSEDISNVKIINYLTNLSVDKAPILEYDANRTMITNKYTNAEYGWNKVEDKNSLIDDVSNNTFSKMTNNYYITLDAKNSELLRKKDDDHIMGPGGERYVKLILSKYLSTDTKDDNTNFSTTTEILEYSNDLGVRMQQKFTNSSGKLDRVDIIPGNSIEGLNKVTDINGISISETDYAESMRVIVIPPTGARQDIVLSVIVFIEVLLIVLFRRLRRISRR